MKITINTSAPNFEMANFLLEKAFEHALKNKAFQEHFKVAPEQLAKAELFRKQLVKAVEKGRTGK